MNQEDKDEDMVDEMRDFESRRNNLQRGTKFTWLWIKIVARLYDR